MMNVGAFINNRREKGIKVQTALLTPAAFGCSSVIVTAPARRQFPAGASGFCI
jgi:hypothetical protein